MIIGYKNKLNSGISYVNDRIVINIRFLQNGGTK